MKLRETGHCANCELLAKRLARQDAEIAALRTPVDASTCPDYPTGAAIGRCAKDSSTSSKPPSSDMVKPPKPSRKDGKKRRRGAQPGHEQHLRTPFPSEAVNKFAPYTLDCCPECGGTLVASRREPEVLQQVEITATPTVVTEHQGLAYWCPHCRKFHYAPLPDAIVKSGLLVRG